MWSNFTVSAWKQKKTKQLRSEGGQQRERRHSGGDYMDRKCGKKFETAMKWWAKHVSQHHDSAPSMDLCSWARVCWTKPQEQRPEPRQWISDHSKTHTDLCYSSAALTSATAAFQVQGGILEDLDPESSVSKSVCDAAVLKTRGGEVWPECGRASPSRCFRGSSYL